MLKLMCGDMGARSAVSLPHRWRAAWAGSRCHAVAMTSGIGKTTPAVCTQGGRGGGLLQLKNI